jgi:diaminopropionate ammonia-lyase family
MSTFRRPVFINQNAQHATNSIHDTTDIQDFHRGLPNYNPTPLISLPSLAQELNVKNVLIKDESNRLSLPSFKILGASWGVFRALATKLGLSLQTALEEMGEAARKESMKLFAATDGNHGRAVAHVAKGLGIPAHIFIPAALDQQSRSAISLEGASIFESSTYEDAVMEAATTAESTKGGILIQDSAFLDYETIPGHIVDGCSTMLQEIDSQLLELGHTPSLVVCPVGVGSLAHAVVRHYKTQSLRSKIATVEPDTAASLYKSLNADEPVNIGTSHTIMTGMDCGTVSSTAWPALRSFVDASLTISDFEAHCAVQDLESCGIKAGPCGAAGLAGLKLLASTHRKDLGIDREAVVVLFNTEGTRQYPVPHDISCDDWVSLTQVLTRIESTNPSLSISDGSGEGIIANYIQAWLEHRGIESHRLECTKGRPSVVGMVRGMGNGGRSLMINGHIDTVGIANYDTDPLDGKLVCRDGK